MEHLPSKFFDIEDISDKIKQVEIPHVEGIIVDENHQISENAKWGCELAKNRDEWYRFFGL